MFNQYKHKTAKALSEVLPNDCYEYCKEYLPELFECEPHEIYQFVQWYPNIQEVYKTYDFAENLEDYVSIIYDAAFEGILVVV